MNNQHPVNLTEQQQEWICYMIGEWYLHWKHQITDPGNLHRLGVAKEQLKAILCNDKEFFDTASVILDGLQ